MAVAHAAISAIHSGGIRPDGMDASKGSQEGLHLDQQPLVETLPPVVERVMAGELSRQVEQPTGKMRQKRHVVLSQTSISLCRSGTDILLYQIPLDEIVQVQVQGKKGDEQQTTFVPSFKTGPKKSLSRAKSTKAFDSGESWISSTATSTDLVSYVFGLENHMHIVCRIVFTTHEIDLVNDDTGYLTQVDLVNDETDHSFIIHTKPGGLESGFVMCTYFYVLCITFSLKLDCQSCTH